MNEEHIIELLNAVLGMQIGEVRALREEHIGPSTIHRYRDGWYVLLNFPDHLDREPADRRALGWFFHHIEDITDFLTGEMRGRHIDFVLTGSGQ